MEAYIRKVIEGVSNTRGADFLNCITIQLSEIIKANYVFIALLDRERFLSKTIALVANGKLIDNFEYSLEYTPCENVADNSICIYENDVQAYFPKDQLLIDMNINGYLGTPLHGANGDVMGLIVALYEQPIESKELTLTLFQIFSGRIAAELERQEYEKKLIDLNNSLENKVEERTSELKVALERLEDTQEQLIESEKLASLGSLVAGVAHEVNTPLGVAITAQSIISDEFSLLCRRLDDSSLSIENMDQFRSAVTEAVSLLDSNLNRARDLIVNFKKTAVDQNLLELETIKINEYYHQISSSIGPLLKEANIELEIKIPSELTITSFPGAHVQLISNLLHNSALHAFDMTSENRAVRISAWNTDETLVCIRYEDNGKGLSAEVRQNIFNPFFTTARDKGGSGLGMSIVYNLVRKNLQGQLKIDDNCRGFAIEITIPKTLPVEN